MKLGVNIDHIATLREARAINEPDPLEALFVVKNARADQVTLHLREDRRHINELDLKRVIESSLLPVNVECSIDKDVVSIVSLLKPNRVTIVPEKREEITTEGGLDVKSTSSKIKGIIEVFRKKEIETSLFIDPDRDSIDISKKIGADAIELHTGRYANLFLAKNSNINHTQHKLYNKLSRSELKSEIENELKKIEECATYAKSLGLFVAAGHGLNYQNVEPIVKIKDIEELNIGHSIIAKALFVGLKEAVEEMVILCQK
ncbi:MAG: pyridoxine 5'-phosphate synthase [Campylobacterales bacterium]